MKPSQNHKNSVKNWFKSGLDDLKRQWYLMVFFLGSVAFCMWMSYSSTSLPKVCVAWLFAAIICVQVTTDFLNFSSAENKSIFTAALRVIAGTLALFVAYNL